MMRTVTKIIQTLDIILLLVLLVNGCMRGATKNACDDMSEEELQRLQELYKANLNNPDFDIQADDPSHCSYDSIFRKNDHVWLGDAPDGCNRVQTDCEKFGLIYDGVQHKKGNPDDTSCDKGHKIRCVPPNPPELVTTPYNKLKVISFNAYERPFYISRDGQRERTCRIPYEFINAKPDVDVIGLQEIFMEGCFERDLNITHLFKHNGFPYVTYPIRQNGKMLPGGIIIASRWPIIEYDQHVFKTVSKWSAESFAAKGVKYIKIRKTVDEKFSDYNILFTHLQAFDMNMNSGIQVEGVRLGQSVEWEQFYQTLNIPEHEPVIFAGDFNVDYHTRKVTLNRIAKNLNAAFPTFHVRANDFTWGPPNDVFDFRSNTKTKPIFIDYILYGINHRRPKSADLHLFKPYTKPFPLCWCEGCLSWTKYRWTDDPNCIDKVWNFTSLSDHQAVIAEFEF